MIFVIIWNSILGESDGPRPFGVASPDSEIATQGCCLRSRPSTLLSTFHARPPYTEIFASVVSFTDIHLHYFPSHQSSSRSFFQLTPSDSSDCTAVKVRFIIISRSIFYLLEPSRSISLSILTKNVCISCLVLQGLGRQGPCPSASLPASGRSTRPP